MSALLMRTVYNWSTRVFVPHRLRTPTDPVFTSEEKQQGSGHPTRLCMSQSDTSWIQFISCTGVVLHIVDQACAFLLRGIRLRRRAYHHQN